MIRFYVLLISVLIMNAPVVFAAEPESPTTGVEVSSQDTATQRALARVKAAGLDLHEAKYYRNV